MFGKLNTVRQWGRMMRRRMTIARLERARWPQVIQFETTNRCNLRCTMCPTTYNPTTHITAKESVVSAVLAASLHIKALRPYLNGEPLMYPQVFDLMERARALNPKIDLAFNTNGMLLNEEARRRICRLPMNHVVVSMDGATAATYNAIRVGGDFDKLLENLSALTAERGAYAAGKLPGLSLQMTVHRGNVDEMPALVRLAHRLDFQGVMFNNLEPYCAAQAGAICYGAEPDAEYVKIFEETASEARRLGLFCTAALLRADGVPRYCPALQVMYITANGDVFPCGQLMSDTAFWYLGEERRHRGPLCMGSLPRQSVEEVWNSEKYRAFRRSIRAGNFHDECYQCLMAQSIVCNTQPYRLDV